VDATSLRIGGVLANPGFIQQFGTLTTATGAPALDPAYVVAWSGIVHHKILFESRRM
jgi:hypothetical protein